MLSNHPTMAVSSSFRPLSPPPLSDPTIDPPLQPIGTVRDFRTLKRLLERLEREFVSASGDEEHNVDKRAAALELFRRRVGRSAQQVAEE
jgi:hypothetical protein